jgi:hypothetical protein
MTGVIAYSNIGAGRDGLDMTVDVGAVRFERLGA